MNGNKNQTTVDILKDIPFYKNFPNVRWFPHSSVFFIICKNCLIIIKIFVSQVYADFMMMELMSTITEEIFKHNFDLLVENFRRYLFQHTGKKYGEEENGTLEVLLAINALCSAKQGDKISTPVFKSAKVNICFKKSCYYFIQRLYFLMT